jgi:hypothetical protein
MDERMTRLEPFIGEWRLEAPAFPMPDELAEQARATFEWVLDGAFLLERTHVPEPVVPDGLLVIAPADGDDAYLQHYFDSRGVVRLYTMTFDGRVWTLQRSEADFSPLDFHQRFEGTFSDDGEHIEGRWESSPDGSSWELDFELFYRRLSRG